ncbi:MAG: peptidoglycan DD-metalloendopeptidase family protein [Parcubacteria group bacterium]|nr:peptidoglycan DD-metalloendopeptidase family protein [Parcubacteria group bacterium]
MFSVDNLWKNPKRTVLFAGVAALAFLGYLGYAPGNAPAVFSAGLIDELRSKIQERNSEIEKLEQEIKRYETEITTINKATRTLTSTVAEITTTERKLRTDITLTERKINTAALTIQALSDEIADKEARIKTNTAAIGEIVRRMHELESRSLIEIFLSRDTFSSFWDIVENLGRLEKGVAANVAELEFLKEGFLTARSEREAEKTRQTKLRNQLADQKELVAASRAQQEKLLRETKNKETLYQNLLEERLARKEALESEIAAFEDQLRVEIDPSSLPPTGMGGVLSWPLASVTVTQYFGNTPFASKNPQIYNGGGHNGIDLRASVGTPVLAAANGIVVDTGDTDTGCYGASYGKWVLVKHYNNLATLYAHLSLIRVAAGEEVRTGDLVGYSGNTGYSTGPHLHFSVYAASAVRVTDAYKSKVCKTNLKLPLSPRNGYLNPLSYLPALDN